MMIFFFILACTFLATGPFATAAQWHLVWSDEFNGPATSRPDPGKWKFDLGTPGWRNQELEEYTDSLDNVFVDGKGHLAIQVVRSGTNKYTSGRLKTAGLFEIQYGKIEARIRIPFGKGIWSAFWMLGKNFTTDSSWPGCGEIDIMENIGREPMIVHGTLHGPGYSDAYGITSQASLRGGGRFADQFHVFAVEWSANKLEFFVDGNSYSIVSRRSLPAGTSWVFDHPFFLLFNVAVGGKWPGNPDESTYFPQIMYIDWVRVWKTGPIQTPRR